LKEKETNDKKEYDVEAFIHSLEDKIAELEAEKYSTIEKFDEIEKMYVKEVLKEKQSKDKIIQEIEEIRKNNEDLNEKIKAIDKAKDEEWLEKFRKYKEEIENKGKKEKNDLKIKLESADKKIKDYESRIASLEEDIEIEKEENEELEKELKFATKALNLNRMCEKMLQNETKSTEKRFTESQNKPLFMKNKKNKKFMKV